MRAILHSDMNSYYVSVEQMLDPKLKDKPVAVCGSTETRHGIVLAKSIPAKKCGVQTGMATWEAKQACPDLIVVPPQYEQYVKYSAMAHEIYYRYTDLIEPYGMDECWLDVTGNKKKSAVVIAEEIRNSMKNELGLTVSIGVSFNKVFAKLGSDMKKPDAVTVISENNFKEKIWNLPAGELLWVGRKTASKLARHCIYTIGDIAACKKEYMKSWFGVNGTRIWEYANGTDYSRVAPYGHSYPLKSVSHGMTCVSDLINTEEVKNVLYGLAPKVSKQLRDLKLLAKGVMLSLRDNNLAFREYQCRLSAPTRTTKELVERALQLFKEKYGWEHPLRAVCIRAINLVNEDKPIQLSLLDNQKKREKQEKIERTADEIREIYGKNAVTLGCAMNTKLKKDASHELAKMPAQMYV